MTRKSHSDDSTDIGSSLKTKEQTEISNVRPPPDGGWGWFCVLGCAIMHIVVGGIGRSAGIIFLVIQEKFHHSASVTAWLVSIGDTILLVFSPVSSALCNRFTCRKVAMVGAFVFCLSFILSSVVPGFEFLFLSYGFLGGIGQCLCYTPALVIVGLYFNKKRSIATALGTAGSGVGTLFMPPLIEVFLSAYAFSGTMLLLGGIVLQMCIAAALFRPLSIHEHITTLARKREMHEGKAKEESTIFFGSSTNGLRETPVNGEENIDRSILLESNNEVTNMTDSPLVFTDETISHHKSYCEIASTIGDDVCSVSIVSDIQPEPTSLTDATASKSKLGTSRRPLFEFCLLLRPRFFCFCISITMYMIGANTAITFLPALATEKGITAIRGALLVSIFGGSDFAGRLVAAVMDHKTLKVYRVYIYSVFPLLLSVVAILLTVATNFAEFAVITVFVGLLVGLYTSQKLVIIVDMLGADKLVTSLGLINMFQGLGVLIGPPVSGFLRDELGSYNESYYFCTAVFFASFLLLLTGNFIHWWKQRGSSEPTKEKETL